MRTLLLVASLLLNYYLLFYDEDNKKTKEDKHFVAPNEETIEKDESSKDVIVYHLNFENAKFANGVYMNLDMDIHTNVENVEEKILTIIGRMNYDSKIITSSDYLKKEIEKNAPYLEINRLDKKLCYVIYDESSPFYSDCVSRHATLDISEIDASAIAETQKAIILFKQNINLWENVYVVFGEPEKFKTLIKDSDKNNVLGSNYGNLNDGDENTTIVYLNYSIISKSYGADKYNYQFTAFHELGHSIVNYDVYYKHFGVYKFADISDEEKYCNDFAYKMSDGTLDYRVKDLMSKASGEHSDNL